MASGNDHEYAPLTFRLAGVLELRGFGWTYDQIGDMYGIKGTSVREYLRDCRSRLGVDTIAAAIEEAVRRGLIDLSGQRPECLPPRWQMPDQ